MAWYNKYRPQDFSEVLGQGLVKSVLENALKREKIKQAYLLSGPKGVGKTTLARIFASELNKTKEKPENTIDIIELDAASNTGIDNIRQLIESSKNPPIAGPYKIYIIDEVHMLSKPAMNALLKILEEPPEYLVFLLATTNPEKLLPTVLSRLTKLSLTAHSTEDLNLKLKEISQKENLNISQKALDLITHRSQGSHRDSINLLETISSYELDKYDEKEVAEILGILPNDLLFNICSTLKENLLTKELLQTVEKTGVDGQTLLSQLLEFAIDKSFSNENDFDFLILPIAQTLELKLSINSSISALAILKANLKNTQTTEININNEPKKLKEIIDFASETKEEKKSPEIDKISQKPSQQISELEEIPHFEEVSSPEKEEKNSTVSPQIGQEKEEISIEKVNNLFHSLTSQDGTPPIFKMILIDLQVDSVENDTVKLSVSSGVFLSQLSSSKVQLFLIQALNQKFSKELKLESILRDHKVQENNQNSFKPKNVSELGNAEENETKTQLDLKPVNKANQPNLKTNKKIFYKVYDNLPQNMENSGVEVLKGPLKNPGMKDDWDEHAENMFEFE